MCTDDLSVMVNPDEQPEYRHDTIGLLAQRVRAAREKGASVLMMMGGHVVRAGVGPCLIRLAEEGYITHFAFNGATAIHDFEFAMIGATTESVAKVYQRGAVRPLAGGRPIHPRPERGCKAGPWRR